MPDKTQKSIPALPPFTPSQPRRRKNFKTLKFPDLTDKFKIDITNERYNEYFEDESSPDKSNDNDSDVSEYSDIYAVPKINFPASWILQDFLNPFFLATYYPEQMHHPRVIFGLERHSFYKWILIWVFIIFLPLRMNYSTHHRVLHAKSLWSLDFDPRVAEKAMKEKREKEREDKLKRTSSNTDENSSNNDNSNSNSNPSSSSNDASTTNTSTESATGHTHI